MAHQETKCLYNSYYQADADTNNAYQGDADKTTMPIRVMQTQTMPITNRKVSLESVCGMVYGILEVGCGALGGTSGSDTPLTATRWSCR